MRLLIIEDDRDAADYLVKAFREVGHIAEQSADGEEGLALALEGQYDVLIVDRMLPKLDGLAVIGALRSKSVETPVLILSALGQVDGFLNQRAEFVEKALFAFGDGVFEILEAAERLQKAMLVTGKLTLAVTVNSKGEPINVQSILSPDKQMTKIMAEVLLLQKYSPGSCKGVPCQMQYPLRIDFALR